jgi:hypothetical protein
MSPNRRAQERERAAERKAAVAVRKLFSKAERAAWKARRRRAIVRDAIIAVVIALVLFCAWKLIPLAVGFEALP